MPSTKRARVLAALALAPALALGLPACGGEGGGAAGRAAGDRDGMREFAQCMRDNGVDMPDPSADGRVEIRQSAAPGERDGQDGQDKAVAAQEKCRHLMPNGGEPPTPDPAHIAAMRAHSQCMRDNGIAGYPDPNPDGSMLLEGEKGGDIDPQSPGFKKALEACAKHAPDGEGPSSTGRDE
ncbi:hypothetical protein [Actinomadura sp. WMMB 499]|uniref:hypothetical protein n=1 Tax=Actinomadura sp. WMMB 499 TaxID=1219491 RepID=UPI0012455F88|nr:hypothetical protein [Actinomadura sp. WMMB 499]QFG26525.1 hypothetical protein F7P10_40715 [Actinomadura sp. WMMB 499]